LDTFPPSLNLESTVGGFNFNGIDSRNIFYNASTLVPISNPTDTQKKNNSYFGLVCRTEKRIILSERKTRYVEFVNMNGSFALDSPNHEMEKFNVNATLIGGLGYYIENNQWQTSTEPGQASVFNFQDIRNKIKVLKNWFNTTTWRSLFFYDDPLNTVYQAKIDSEIAGSLTKLQAVLSFDIEFVISMNS